MRMAGGLFPPSTRARRPTGSSRCTVTGVEGLRGHCWKPVSVSTRTLMTICVLDPDTLGWRRHPPGGSADAHALSVTSSPRTRDWDVIAPAVVSSDHVAGPVFAPLGQIREPTTPSPAPTINARASHVI